MSLKENLKALGIAFGYDIKVRPISGCLDFRGSRISARTLGYYTHPEKLVVAKLTEGRGLPIYCLGSNTRHPHIRALLCTLRSKSHCDIQGLRANLKNTLAESCWDSAAALLQMPTHPILKKHPPWATVLPWQENTLEEWKNKVFNSVYAENKREGVSHSVTSGGWAWSGPISEQKLDIETKRLFNVFNSILENGYVRSCSPGGDPPATILLREDDEWRWQPHTNQHRLCVLSALGYSEVPIRVRNVVRREDVDYWPNVVSGLFSRKHALQVFDGIFNSGLEQSLSSDEGKI